MSNLLWQMIRVSPKFSGWAIATFTWSFVFQVVLLALVSLFRYHDLQVEQTANWYDYMWFIYREMPAMIPMILVFAMTSTILGLIVGVYVRIGSTVSELPTLARSKPLTFLWEVVLPPASMIIGVIGIIFQYLTLSYFALMLLAFYFSHKTVIILIAWARTFTTLVANEVVDKREKDKKQSKEANPEETVSINSLRDPS